MPYQLGIRENSIDSFNEALAKYREGEEGQVRAYKFAILHMAHFLELVLKVYVQSLDENLIYLANYLHLKDECKKAGGGSILAHLNSLKAAGFSYITPKSTHQGPPKTIMVHQALSLAKDERCSITGGLFVDAKFIADIDWLKGLRNSIEHFQFEIEPKEVRLCLGRIVRNAEEFLDVFSLFVLPEKVSAENNELYHQLADEYEHHLREAKIEAKGKENDAFRGVRHKFHELVEFRRYECPECSEDTLITETTSYTGYRCTNCGNEESDEIEIPCDCCGALVPSGEMASWEAEDGEYEQRCEFCTGENSIGRDGG